MRTLARLVEHLVWADGQVGSALRDAPDAKSAEILAHVAAASVVWLDRIAGVPQSVAVWPANDVDATCRLAASAHARLRELVRTADAAALARLVTYRTSDGREFTSSVEDMLLQVALHGQHHRAQIATRLREAGAKPPSLDYIAWARGGAAATRPPG